MQFVCLLFKLDLRNSWDYEEKNIWLTRLAGWTCKTCLSETNKKPWQARNGRKISWTNRLKSWYKNSRTNIRLLYGGKTKLTDSSIYKVEIAQFQDFMLQKQKFQFAQPSWIFLWAAWSACSITWPGYVTKRGINTHRSATISVARSRSLALLPEAKLSHP